MKQKNNSKLQSWIEQKGGTRKVAILLDVSQSTIQHWVSKRATPSLKLASKLAKLSKLSIEEILKATT